MKNSVLDVIVIGAGHAGLSASYYLTKYGMKHLVLERGRIGESWRTQRWDSFVLNTANAINVLPGNYYAGRDGEQFASATRFAAALKIYAAKFQLPVREQSEVIAVEKPAGKKYFELVVSEKGHRKNYRSKQVIVCSGSQNQIQLPAVSKNIDSRILQLHAGEYRSASQLPAGSVLVVGSAQSGCQIAEDLAVHARKVYLSTSMVPRVPRRYRGEDIMDWLIALKFFDTPTQQDPEMRHMRAPQLAGGKKTISLQSLAKKDITILGKLTAADAAHAYLAPNAAAHVQFADGFSKMAKNMIDEFIVKRQLNAPPAAEDPADAPDVHACCVSSIEKLNFKEHQISSVIWATGFGGNFTYLKLPVLDKNGQPEHQDGLTAAEGLYFLGLSWLRTRKSSLIYGINEDAAFICKKVLKQLKPTIKDLVS